MRIKSAIAAAAALIATATMASAADLAVKARPVVPVEVWSWTGFYIGGHVGAAFGNDNNFGGLVVGSNNDARFLGGVQGGFDYQFAPNWVFGAEAQYSWLSGNAFTATFPNGYIYTNDRRGIGSVTGRLGYTWGPGLLYVKGGYAFADNNDRLVLAGVPQAFSFDGNHKDGYTVGAGFEYMFAQNWSGKVEYQYYNFGDSRFVTPVALAPFGSYRNDEHTVKVGINYRFNLGGAGPVVAKY